MCLTLSMGTVPLKSINVGMCLSTLLNESFNCIALLQQDSIFSKENNEFYKGFFQFGKKIRIFALAPTKCPFLASH